MFSIFSLAALALLPAVFAQTVMVNTPQGVVQCEPVAISWTGGSAPYFLSFVPAGQAGAPAIKQFPTQNGNSLTWTADLGPGTSFTISLKDSQGNQGFSDIVTIQSGPNSGCINTSITETVTGGVAAPTSGSNSGSASAATTTAAASSSIKSASSGTASTTSSAASSSSSTKPNGGSSNRGNALAVAGVMGLVGAILF